MTDTLKNRTRILVCCHKQDLMATEPPYMPVHVGKTLSDTDLGIAGDDTGDNISAKNRTYCEMTGLYWAWKNLKDAEIIGLCHYRRYFDFHRQIKPGLYCQAVPSSRFAVTDLGIPERILERVAKGGIIAASGRSFRFSNMVQYCVNHSSMDFRVLEQVVREKSDDKTYMAFRSALYGSNRLSPYNMFIMRREDFDEYCSWVFPILEETESRLSIRDYPDYQKRVFGFMAERLLCVYVFHHTELRLRYGMMVQVDDSFPIQYRKAVRCRFGGRYLQRLAAVMLRRRILRLWRKLKK